VKEAADRHLFGLFDSFVVPSVGQHRPHAVEIIIARQAAFLLHALDVGQQAWPHPLDHLVKVWNPFIVCAPALLEFGRIDICERRSREMTIPSVPHVKRFGNGKPKFHDAFVVIRLREFHGMGGGMQRSAHDRARLSDTKTPHQYFARVAVASDRATSFWSNASLSECPQISGCDKYRAFENG
jgi:hypothetical protein